MVCCLQGFLSRDDTKNICASQTGGGDSRSFSTGLTPIDVAANRNNIHMKVLLEGCALFKGTLTLPIAKLFGGKLMDR